MSSQLLHAEKKLAKYAIKLDDSPYYLAARILDPECHTAFLKDKDTMKLTLEGERKLYVVQKLWERFRDKALPSTSYETTKNVKPALRSGEQLSAFHKIRRQHIEQQTRPQSQDEFDNYVSESPIPLDNRTTSIQWWCHPLQRTRFPRLSQLAMEVLSIPGMSDKPERVFSGSRRCVPWDRTKTSSRLLEEAECLKDWTDYGILKVLL